MTDAAAAAHILLSAMKSDFPAYQLSFKVLLSVNLLISCGWLSWLPGPEFPYIWRQVSARR